MSQPKWKFVAQLGDVNPLDHGGKFLFVDETGVYPPELEFVELLVDSIEDEWEVHRIVLDKCTFIDGVLSDNKFHQAWFAQNLQAVADCVDVDESELIGRLCSGDALNRAQAYVDIVSYYGVHEFDQYPRMFDDRAELEARYADCVS